MIGENPQGIILVGLRPSHHQLPACGLRICQTYVLETAADVAETLVQPSGVAAWWMCNLGTQYIKCSIFLTIQKLSFEARGGGIACQNVGFQPLHHLYSWQISALLCICILSGECRSLRGWVSLVLGFPKG